LKVVRLRIKNFRGIKKADLDFDGHTLLLGMNNVGKSTVCEALDLVLGPDRLGKFPPIEEFDFYNAQYLSLDGQEAPTTRVEVLLTDLSPEVERSCSPHTEFWHRQDRRLLESGEVDKANPPDVVRCLRLETIGQYNSEEDEFEASTFFSHSPSEADGKLEKVPRPIKRLFGFLYLRTLRTGSRALSLERGSLLDIILRMQGVRTGLWEQSIRRLRGLDPPIDNDATDLVPVLETIEKRLAQYILLNSKDRATKLFVSQLTREHLRKTMAFFLSVSSDQNPVPFQEVGTGTLNTLVLALLSFIADIKKDNVIFAMEEPEIALPPHTQRRIANYLLEETTQCFVTSHSPYVIERFSPDQIMILRRNDVGELTATPVSRATSLKGKLFKRHARRGLAEAMLGVGVIVSEGITEQAVLLATAERLEDHNPDLMPLDLAGVTVLAVDGDGSMPAFGTFFKELGIRTYAYYDKKNRKVEELQKFKNAFDVPNETDYKGMEHLLASETPLQRQWEFLTALRNASDGEEFGIPADEPKDDAILRGLIVRVLKAGKGNEFATRLIEYCHLEELPPSITTFLGKVYQDFPKPKPVPLPPKAGATATPPTNGTVLTSQKENSKPQEASS
jgi:putative ATP-dependent endonuclease of OLD family